MLDYELKRLLMARFGTRADRIHELSDRGASGLSNVYKCYHQPPQRLTIPEHLQRSLDAPDIRSVIISDHFVADLLGPNNDDGLLAISAGKCSCGEVYYRTRKIDRHEFEVVSRHNSTAGIGRTVLGAERDKLREEGRR